MSYEEFLRERQTNNLAYNFWSQFFAVFQCTKRETQNLVFLYSYNPQFQQFINFRVKKNYFYLFQMLICFLTDGEKEEYKRSYCLRKNAIWQESSKRSLLLNKNCMLNYLMKLMIKKFYQWTHRQDEWILNKRKGDVLESKARPAKHNMIKVQGFQNLQKEFSTIFNVFEMQFLNGRIPIQGWRQNGQRRGIIVNFEVKDGKI
jgi:hypothetical protein